jgi:hypothetical protein
MQGKNLSTLRFLPVRVLFRIVQDARVGIASFDPLGGAICVGLPL